MPKFSIRRLWSLVRNNPDYFGAVATAYMVVGMQVLVQIALIPLYLSTLGKYQFGVLMMFMSAVNVAFIGISWTYGGVLRLLGEATARGDAKGFAEGYLALKFIFVGYAVIVGGVAFLVLVLFPSAASGDQAESDIVLAAAAALAYFVLLCEFTTDQMALNARKQQAIANLILVGSLVIFVALVVPWLRYGGGLAGVFGCLVVGYAAARATVWLFWRRSKVSVRWGIPGAGLAGVLARLGALVRQGYLAYGMIFMALQSDVLLVGWLGGAEAAGEFVLVWKAAEILIIALWRLSESLMPQIVHSDASRDHARLRRIYDNGVWVVRLVALAAGTAYAVLGQWAVSLWVGPDAAPATIWGYVAAGAVVTLVASARFPAVFLYALARLRPLIIVAGLELVIKLILLVLLFQYVGYLAPLLAIVIVHTGGIAVAYARLPRMAFRTADEDG